MMSVVVTNSIECVLLCVDVGGALKYEKCVVLRERSPKRKWISYGAAEMKETKNVSMIVLDWAKHLNLTVFLLHC